MKILQKQWTVLALSIILAGTYSQGYTQSMNRKSFYSAMASGNVKAIEAQISSLKNSEIEGRLAFEGAMLMKKAGVVKGAGKKLNLFKDGHKKLEAAIEKDTDNAEYRFLRLMIQEHAPGILGYKDDLKKDSAYIRQSYKKLPAEVQQAIVDYSKTSKVISPGDFNL